MRKLFRRILILASFICLLFALQTVSYASETHWEWECTEEDFLSLKTKSWVNLTEVALALNMPSNVSQLITSDLSYNDIECNYLVGDSDIEDLYTVPELGYQVNGSAGIDYIFESTIPDGNWWRSSSIKNGRTRFVVATSGAILYDTFTTDFGRDIIHIVVFNNEIACSISAYKNADGSLEYIGINGNNFVNGYGTSSVKLNYNSIRLSNAEGGAKLSVSYCKSLYNLQNDTFKYYNDSDDAKIYELYIIKRKPLQISPEVVVTVKTNEDGTTSGYYQVIDSVTKTALDVLIPVDIRYTYNESIFTVFATNKDTKGHKIVSKTTTFNIGIFYDKLYILSVTIPVDTAPPSIVMVNASEYDSNPVQLAIAFTDDSPLPSDCVKITGPGISGYKTMSEPGLLPVSYNGEYSAVITDAAGKTANASIEVNNIDSVAPTVKYSIYPSTPTNGEVEVIISSHDNSRLHPTDPLYVNGVSVKTPTHSKVMSSNGTISVYSKDASGNVSQTYTINITNIDKVSPTLVASATSHSTYGVITATASDAQSGIKEITVDGVKLTGQTYTVYFDGTYTVEAIDNAGNKTSKSVTISGIDSVPPSVTIVKSTTGWTNMPVTVNVYSSDNNKLATSYPLYVNGQGYASGEFEKTFTANQQNAISAYAKDAAGNVSPTKTVSIDNIDTIAPAWAGSVTYSQDKSTATITALVTDAGGSGLKKLNANGADRPLTGYTWTVNSNGLYAVMATDNAGNVLNYYVPVTSIDTTPPSISVQWNPSANTITKQTTLKFTVSDDNPHATPLSISIDGVSQGTNLANGYTITVDRNCSITVTAKDAAGNTKTDTISVNNIDTIPPVVSSVTTNYNSWTNQPVIATVTASDDKALHSAPYQYTFEPISGGSTSTGWTSSKTFTVTDNGTLKVQVRDSVGNLSTVYSKVIDFIDKLPPTATVTYTPDLSTLVTPEEGTSVRIEVVDQAIPGLLSNSGVGGSYIQWQDQTNWTSSNTRTFNENRTYYYRVRDNAGNMSAFIAVPITNIRTDAPHIISFTSTGGTGDWFKAPALLTVIAEATEGSAALDSRPYSWDNGLTWTSDNTKQVTESGTYSVIVRNTLGQTSTSSITLTSLDGGKPSVDTSLIKRPPADDQDAPEDEWVWWIKVDATDDGGSGISSITNVSTGETSTTSPAYFEINDADRIDFEVVDNVGNTATDYIVVEDWVLGSNDNSDPALEPGQPIIPEEKPGSVQVDLTGDIGLDDAKISDLVFGTNGVYNKKTNQYADYLNPASAIIKYSTEFKTDPERTLSGSMTFAGNSYTVSFGSIDPTTGMVVATGSIPVSSISRDINNGRLEVSIEEKAEDEVVRVGSVQTTTSAQITPPSLNHTYNRALDKMLLTATSTIVGIREITYQLDGGPETEYTEPFSIGSATTIVLKVVDNVGSEFSYSLSASDLSINNGTDGLPTVEIPAGSDIEVYHSSNRTADIFIIGGSRTNTTQMPSSSIFSNAA